MSATITLAVATVTNRKSKTKEKWESKSKDGPPFRRDIQKRQSSADHKGRDLSDTPEHPADKENPPYDRTGDYDYAPVKNYGEMQYHYEGKIVHCDDVPMTTTGTLKPGKPAHDGMTEEEWRKLQWLNEDGGGNKSIPDDFRPQADGGDVPKPAPPPGDEKQQYFRAGAQSAGLLVDPPQLLLLTRESKARTLTEQVAQLYVTMPRVRDA